MVKQISKEQICKYNEINDENLFLNYLLISRKRFAILFIFVSTLNNVMAGNIKKFNVLF